MTDPLQRIQCARPAYIDIATVGNNVWSPSAGGHLHARKGQVQSQVGRDALYCGKCVNRSIKEFYLIDNIDKHIRLSGLKFLMYIFYRTFRHVQCNALWVVYL